MVDYKREVSDSVSVSDDIVIKVVGVRARAAVGSIQVHATGLVMNPGQPVLDRLVADVLLAAVVTPIENTDEGQLVKALYPPLFEIVRLIQSDPAVIMQIDPRKWEEIVCGAYDASGEYDRVTLTPRSGDLGRDVIAEKDGFGSIRLIESVKRYKPGLVVPADDVRALLGVITADRKASKGVISTTSTFAPKIAEDPLLAPFLGTRIELVDGEGVVRRFEKYLGGRKR